MPSEWSRVLMKKKTAMDQRRNFDKHAMLSLILLPKYLLERIMHFTYNTTLRTWVSQWLAGWKKTVLPAVNENYFRDWNERNVRSVAKGTAIEMRAYGKPKNEENVTRWSWKMSRRDRKWNEKTTTTRMSCGILIWWSQSVYFLLQKNSSYVSILCSTFLHPICIFKNLVCN